MSQIPEMYRCQCCGSEFEPPSVPKSFFPVLCWECSHEVIANLSMFCRRACYAGCHDNDFKLKLKDYLDRKGLQGSILR